MTEQLAIKEPNGRPLIELKDNGPTFMQLLSLAIQNNSAIDVIERLAALQREAMTQRALIEFNEALNRAQKEIKRIAPDMENPKNKNKWASYAAIDRVIRPVYSRDGFAPSFTHADCPKPDHIRVVCRLSRGAHVELYQIDWPVDMKGPQGGDVMTKGDATGAADSRAKRYLIKDIFNIAIGEDDGLGSAKLDNIKQRLEEISQAGDQRALQTIFATHYKAAKELKCKDSMFLVINARDKRRGELNANAASELP